MIFIVVEDEPIILEGEMNVLSKYDPDAKIYGYTSADSVMDHLANEPADVVFLDIRMPEKNGVELAREIRVKFPQTNIIFVTAYDDHYREAMEMHASGYILKPMTLEDTARELSELRYPPHYSFKKLFVRTFGDFEVFHNGRPVHFKYQKTKEMFAYLIDRFGSVVTNSELITILWEGKTGKNEYFKQLRKDLIAVLKDIDCEDILIKHRGAIGVIPENISCDYYLWRRGLPAAINAYQGEYMNQYAWAEPTRAALELRGDIWN